MTPPDLDTYAQPGRPAAGLWHRPAALLPDGCDHQLTLPDGATACQHTAPSPRLPQHRRAGAGVGRD